MILKTIHDEEFIVDDDDVRLFDRARFHLMENTYVQAYFPSTRYGAKDNWRVYVHVHIMGRRDVVDGLQVDHIDGNTLNNSRSNLRLSDAVAQQFNTERV